MADGKRMIARALYDRAGKEEKQEAGRFFDKLDLNKDGRISLREFQKGYVASRLSSDTVFKELRSNKDGTMNFDDVLTLFYYNKEAIKILRCDECRQLIFGPSFSSNSPHSRHTICCACYGRGIPSHRNHQQASTSTRTLTLTLTLTLTQTQMPTDLLRERDQQHLLLINKPTKAKEEMKELREIAKLHYQTASPNVRQKAERFFDCMDRDGDNKVDRREFLSFMVEQGYRQLRNRQLFDDLDVSGSGALGFWEVMTLYYIVKSGLPNCDLCKAFIPGIFFSCVQCYRIGSSSNLCRNCYKDAGPDYHIHRGGTQFLDNYTLLHTMRASQQRGHDQPSSSSMAIVPASTTSKHSKLDLAYKALELAINLSNTASDIAVAAGKCTIL